MADRYQRQERSLPSTKEDRQVAPAGRNSTGQKPPPRGHQRHDRPAIDTSSTSQPNRPRNDGARTQRNAPELDFFSPQFDALKALRTPGLAAPMKIKPFDTVQRCRALLPVEMPESTAASIGQKSQRSAESIAAQERAKARSVSLEHQRKEVLEDYNPLKDIMAAIKPESPLAMLKPVAERHGRLRVVTRHSSGVRGVAVGFLIAFDRYMNLLMRDVDEEYMVRVWVSRSKAVAQARSVGPQRDAVITTDGRGGGGVAEITEQVERMRVRHRPKQESRKRHLKQILIRGDSVVMASPVA